MEDCFKAAIESLGVEGTPPQPNDITTSASELTQQVAMTLAFTDSDDKFKDEDGG